MCKVLSLPFLYRFLYDLRKLLNAINRITVCTLNKQGFVFSFTKKSEIFVGYKMAPKALDNVFLVQDRKEKCLDQSHLTLLHRRKTFQEVLGDFCLFLIDLNYATQLVLAKRKTGKVYF